MVVERGSELNQAILRHYKMWNGQSLFGVYDGGKCKEKHCPFRDYMVENHVDHHGGNNIRAK